MKRLTDFIKTGFNINSMPLMLLLCGFYPAIFYTSANWFVYVPGQLALLLITVPLAVLLTGLAVLKITRLTEKAAHNLLPSKSEWLSSLRLPELLTAVYAYAALIFLLQEAIFSGRAIFITGAVLLGILAAVLYCVKISAARFVNFFLIAAASASVISTSIAMISGSAILLKADFYPDKNQLASVQLKVKPNIYFITLESYSDNATILEQFGTDNSAVTSALKAMDFKIYENTFSNYSSTLLSLCSVFTMRHNYYELAAGSKDSFAARKIIGGGLYNPLLAVLRGNGYRIQYVLDDSYIFIPGKNLDYYYPPRKLAAVFGIFQISGMDKLLADITGDTKPTWQDYSERVKDRISWAAAQKEPSFTFLRLSATNHPDIKTKWNERQDYLKTYPAMLESENREILEIVSDITAKDPGGIIIMTGDHGQQWHYGVFENSGNINKTLAEAQLPPERISREMFAVLLAVKLPKDLKLNADIISHVNLMRYVLFALSQDPFFIETKEADASYWAEKYWLYTAAEDGKALAQWKRQRPKTTKYTYSK